MKTKTTATQWLASLSLARPAFFIFVALCAGGCQKDLSSDQSGSPEISFTPADTMAAKSAALLTQTIPFPQNASPGCDYAPDYGDTLIQPQPSATSDYIVAPINNKNVNGTYLAWPGGLVIDPKTGSINVTQSETGAKYAVGFVLAGSSDTCMSYLTLGGADYIDSVYASPVSSKSAAPHFNANVSGPSPCTGSKCKFDYDHSAHKQGVYVDDHNGSIDIKNTLSHSIFAVMPIDGMYFYSTIRYMVNDGSNNAPQSIQVKLIYYNYRSAIPASLLQTVTSRADNINAGAVNGISGSTRPPIIIITRYL